MSVDYGTDFWEKVDVRGPDECWPWKAYRMPMGYGRFRLPDNERRLAIQGKTWRHL